MPTKVKEDFGHSIPFNHVFKHVLDEVTNDTDDGVCLISSSVADAKR